MKGCYTWQGVCSDTTACEQGRNQSLPAGVQFKQCVAECCTTDRCNDVVPAMMALPKPSSTSSSVAASSSMSGAEMTTEAAEGPTSDAMSTEASFFLSIFYLVVSVVIHMKN